jgi:hypothetical protein
MQPICLSGVSKKEAIQMVFETYLLALLAVLGVLGILAWVLRAQLRRAGRYFVAWLERDKRAEEEARQQVEVRQQAEQEVRRYLHEEPQEPQEQIVGRQEKNEI